MANPIPTDIPEDVKVRFWAKVDVRELGECWEWKAYKSATGYGLFSLNGFSVKAHRLAATLSGIDAGELIVRHDCDNPSCVNPAHLRIGTIADNNDDTRRRGRQGGFAAANSAKTHCPRGHPYAGLNLRVSPRGLRNCRTCHRERMRIARQNKAIRTAMEKVK